MKIPIQNIYFLLCYAWNTLKEGRIVAVAQDDTSTLVDLFARILDGGVTHLLKRGLDRGYLAKEEDTSSLRGKLDFSTTLKRNLLQHSRAHCVVDSFDYDVLHNQILKTTLHNLASCPDLDGILRARIVRLYRRMQDVSEICLSANTFARVQLHRNNAFYGFLLKVCRLVHDNLLINEQSGRSRFRDFLRDDRQMAVLFERFVRNFYRHEQNAFRVRSEQFDWRGVEATEDDLRLLPKMRTDVSLESSARKIVIDTKYYADTLQHHFESATIHSGNLYQMFTYVKNLQMGDSRPVEGVLMYPTAGQALDLRYQMHGHSLRVVTVNLDTNWRDIRDSLLSLLN